MTWRRWEWGDAKDDAIEYALTDVPVLPGHPKRNCEICMRHIELIEGGDELPRVVRRGSKVVHVRAPGVHSAGLKRTRCGRYYFWRKT